MLALAGCFSSGPSALDDVNRGNAKRDAGDVDGAIAVYSQVLESDAKNAPALLNRGIAEVKIDKREGAMADLNQSILLDPRNSLAYYSRGNLKAILGDFEGAVADYAKTAALAESGEEHADYNRFQFALTLRRLHRDEAPAGLAALVANEQPEKWTRLVGRFLTGDLAEPAFLAAAAAGDDKTALLRQCEAYYYAGMTHLLKNDSLGARDLFNRCLGTGVKSFAVYDLARAEIPRLP